MLTMLCKGIMGTNYYALKNYCNCCGRSDQIHIGKSFRMLRAYGEYSPTGKIECWDDWVSFLSSENILIEDEYGDVIDKESFISKWVPIPGMADRIHEENREWGLQYGTSLGVYLDKQGYKFSTREFS